MTTYTVRGDATLDQLIAGQLTSIKEDVLTRLPEGQIDGLVLGGGYGRGEGGALRTPEGLRPYNDYDLVLLHDIRDKARLTNALQEVHRKQTAVCGVHVDVTPMKTSELRDLPQTLTWYELGQGHHVIHGAPDVLSPLKDRKLTDVPRSEWGRLLFNRGSGLLFSIWALQGKSNALLADESYESFTTRQVQKAWLALGDVWLAENGQYSWSVQDRANSFRAMGEAAPAFKEKYLAATEFKLAPQLELPHSELTDDLAALAPLYSEALRDLPASESRPLVGLYASAKNLSPLRWGLSRPWRYPRERLKRALLAELVGNTLQRERLVGTPEAYQALWERYA